MMQGLSHACPPPTGGVRLWTGGPFFNTFGVTAASGMQLTPSHVCALQPVTAIEIDMDTDVDVDVDADTDAGSGPEVMEVSSSEEDEVQLVSIAGRTAAAEAVDVSSSAASSEEDEEEEWISADPAAAAAPERPSEVCHPEPSCAEASAGLRGLAGMATAAASWLHWAIRPQPSLTLPGLVAESVDLT